MIILILGVLSCKSDIKTDNNKLENSKIDKIDALGNRYLELGRFSGTILVSINNAVVYNQSFGMADYDKKIPFTKKTAFKIGELTSLITEDIINTLVKKGEIKLTAKISNYLQNFNSDYTLKDLLSNKTSDNYNTLGKLIESVTNKSYQNNVEEYCEDLKLDNTYFSKSNRELANGYLYHNYRGKGLELEKSPNYDLDVSFSSMGLKSTANDVFKILKSRSEDLNISGYLENDGFSYSAMNTTKDEKSIIVLSNRKQPITDEILNSTKAIIDSVAYKMPLLRKPYDIDTKILGDFSGNYSINKNVNFKVINTKDSLFVYMGPNKIHLIPQSSTQFYMEKMDASMRFMKDSTGVNRIVLLNGFMDSDEQAVRIK
ncbi:serine hydrolase domain-containing protein [Winogradskyella sp. PE311]|uniref:serine hydrolase domain-containing protein n=1 Tax=Winogradskyella sp. PE311 TaxID=3366943 RepID=UPI003981449D